MHPILHTKDNVGCEEVMSALEECHARGFLYKAIGGCSSAKHAVNMCLRKERLARTAENREKSKQKQREITAAWKEIDDTT